MAAWIVRAASDNRLASSFEEHGLVALGWSGLVGDLRNLSRWQVVGALEGVGITTADEDADELISLRDQVLVGDIVVTPDASRRGFLVGRFAGPYEFRGHSPVGDEDGPYEHTRKVEWWGVGRRDQLSDHLRKDLSGRGNLRRLSGSGEWQRVAEAVRDAPPPPPRATRAASGGTVRTRTPKAAAPPAPPKDKVCPRCAMRKPNSQFIASSEVCADCRADE